MQFFLLFFLLFLCRAQPSEMGLEEMLETTHQLSLFSGY